MVKTTGYEFKKFMHDDPYWYQKGNETYYDSEDITINDQHYDDIYQDLDMIPDFAIIKINDGVVLFDDGTEISLVKFFKRWRKLQNTITIAIEIPIEADTKAIEAAVKEAGGKVIA